MSHIVLIPYPIASKLNPTFEIAHRLKAEGHQITVVGASGLKETTEAQGFPFILAGESGGTSAPVASRSRLRRLLPASKARLDAAADQLGMQGFADLLGALRPDLVLIDVEQHKYILSAVPTGFPVALISTMVSLVKRPGLPPAHLYVQPKVGWQGSLIGIELLWMRYRLRKAFLRLRDRTRRDGLDKLSVLRHHARRAGFDFQANADLHQWLIPFSYRRLTVFSTLIRAFDFPHVPAKQQIYVGAIIARDRREVVEGENADAERLEALIARHRPDAKARRLVYCSFGAFFTGDDTAFVQRLIEAFGERADWDVILGLGGRADPTSLGRLPPNVHVFRWAPQVRALEAADCALIHGGITSINECISQGVPMVVYPFHTTDQYGSAARIAYHRLGIVGDRRTDDARTVVAHVGAVLADPAYRARLESMRELVDRDTREKTAVRAIETFIRTAHGQR
ncbi:MAG: glycosyltransferase family 1 protein [Chloroflexi bacterium]|nr:glycosyltransferase family 1 protein [Chloroflexota bacterium]